jgi:hypothetical protein
MNSSRPPSKRKSASPTPLPRRSPFALATADPKVAAIPEDLRPAPSILEVSPVKGAPGWRLDGQPYVPILAQAGRANPTARQTAATLPRSSFYRSGCAVYTTWEHGPQLGLVWKENGRNNDRTG